MGYNLGSDGLQVSPQQDATYYSPSNAPMSLSTDDAIPPYGSPNEKSGMIEVAKPSRKARICGLRRSIFWIICCAVAILVVGAAVGGGVAASLSKKSATSTNPNNASSISSTAGPTATTGTATSIQSTAISTTTSASATSTTSTSSTSASTSATPFPSSGLLALDCPSIDQTTYVSGSTDFRVQCSVNYAPGAGNSISGTNETTIDACMDACTAYNDLGTKQHCIAITFQANLTAAMQPGQMANCWLEQQTSNGEIGTLGVGSIAAAIITS